MSGSEAQSVLTSADAKAVEAFIIAEAIEGICYGIEAVLTISVCYILIKQGLSKSLPRCFLLAATVIMFFSSTVALMIDIHYDVTQIKQVADLKHDYTPETIRWGMIGIIPTRLSYCLGDLIVVWRAWVLFPQEKFPKYLLGTGAIISIGSAIADSALALKDILDNVSGVNPARNIFPAALLFTNVLATGLIAYRTWHYRHFLKSHFNSVSRKSQVEHVLVLLVESGCIYCGFWIFEVIMITLNGPTGSVVTNYLNNILPHVETIYPTTIILLTALQKTHCDSTLQGPENPQSHQIRTGPGMTVTHLSHSIQFQPVSTSNYSGIGPIQSVNLPDRIEENMTGYNNHGEMKNEDGQQLQGQNSLV